ncbi:hydantoinase/oxoprolinase N-terminal domain-containing protein [Bradyrhizobium sp. TZ2]
MMFRIGVDVGGTYTDLVATDETGHTMFAKSPSTPADQSIGVMAGLDELARRLNVTRAEMLAATDRLIHGTTVATNALLERKGAKVALLTTEGHRDVIEMRRAPQARSIRSAVAAAGTAGAARIAFWCQGAAQGQWRGFDSS